MLIPDEALKDNSRKINYGDDCNDYGKDENNYSHLTKRKIVQCRHEEVDLKVRTSEELEAYLYT